MKLATLKTESGPRPALLEGDSWRVIDAPDLKSVLGRPRAAWRLIDAGSISAGDARCAAPIPNPGKVLCVGMNYYSHAAELGMTVPKYPNLWAKFTESMIGPTDRIQLPDALESTCADYEVELVIVVGKGGRRIPQAQAMEAIAGFCVGNDSSVRDWQSRTREIMQGKAWEHMTPTGPWITTLDDLPDADALQMRAFVNDELRQDSTTGDMIFGPAWLMAYISTFVTLDPGDLIMTGTPSGVGMTFKPPKYLVHGDTVRCEIEGLGSIENVCSRRVETSHAVAS